MSKTTEYETLAAGGTAYTGVFVNATWELTRGNVPAAFARQRLGAKGRSMVRFEALARGFLGCEYEPLATVQSGRTNVSVTSPGS